MTTMNAKQMAKHSKTNLHQRMQMEDGREALVMRDGQAWAWDRNGRQWVVVEQLQEGEF